MLVATVQFFCKTKQRLLQNSIPGQQFSKKIDSKSSELAQLLQNYTVRMFVSNSVQSLSVCMQKNSKGLISFVCF